MLPLHGDMLRSLARLVAMAIRGPIARRSCRVGYCDAVYLVAMLTPHGCRDCPIAVSLSQLVLKRRYLFSVNECRTDYRSSWFLIYFVDCSLFLRDLYIIKPMIKPTIDINF